MQKLQDSILNCLSLRFSKIGASPCLPSQQHIANAAFLHERACIIYTIIYSGCSFVISGQLRLKDNESLCTHALLGLLFDAVL